jgi:dTMP kinase
MQKKSLFIVLEGLDGSGKTSVGQQLVAILDLDNKGGIKSTYEPHNPSCAGVFIRQVLAKEIKVFSPKTLALAFAANRLDHCDREISPWLDTKSGRMIICDRYYLSSLVYQSSPDFPFEAVFDLNNQARKPDIIFFLNVSNQVCYERMKIRNQPEELFEANLSEDREKYFQAIAFLRAKNQDNIIEIDGNGTVEETAAQIITAIYHYAPAWEEAPNPLRGLGGF